VEEALTQTKADLDVARERVRSLEVENGSLRAFGNARDTDVAQAAFQREQILHCKLRESRRRTAELEALLSSHSIPFESSTPSEPQAAVPVLPLAVTAASSADPHIKVLRSVPPTVSGAQATDVVHALKALSAARARELQHASPQLISNMGAHQFVSAEQAHSANSVPITVFADGIYLYAGPLRLWPDPTCQTFCRDVLDGFYPYELRDAFPDGALFDVTDCAAQAFSPALLGAGNLPRSAADILARLPSKKIVNGKVIDIGAAVKPAGASASVPMEGRGRTLCQAAEEVAASPRAPASAAAATGSTDWHTSSPGSAQPMSPPPPGSKARIRVRFVAWGTGERQTRIVTLTATSTLQKLRQSIADLIPPGHRCILQAPPVLGVKLEDLGETATLEDARLAPSGAVFATSEPL
jgi:hypothetical protein